MMDEAWSALKSVLDQTTTFPWFVALLTIAVLAMYWMYKYFYGTFRLFEDVGIKGPKPVLFYGNFKLRQELGLIKFIEKMYQDYGPVVGFFAGRSPNLIVADLDMLKQITVKEFDSFMDRMPFPDVIRQSNNSPRGLLRSCGEEWKTARRTISPTFSASKMKMMVPLVKRSTGTLLEIMQTISGLDESVEVFKLFGAFTMETIMAIAFGRVVDTQRGVDDELTNAAGVMFRGAEEGNKTSAIVLIPLLSNFPFLIEVVRMIFARSKRVAAFTTLQDTALELVKERRASGKKRKYKDLLQLMLDASVDEGSPEESTPSQCPVDKKTLSDGQIVAHSVTFLLAGYETTANSLSYTAYLLALNPHIQERLQDAIDDYFQDKSESEVNYYEATQDINYLEMVVQESLRLFPPAPITTRTCIKTATINGVTIQKGVDIVIPIALLHKSSEYWEDPETFDPERFTPEEKAKRPPLCHMPFGFGPRNCVGMRFAMLETKMALIEVLRKFSFKQCAETEVPLQTVVGITMAPKNGIFLKIVPRDEL